MFSYASKGPLLSPATPFVGSGAEIFSHSPSPNKDFRAVSSRNIGSLDRMGQRSPQLGSFRARSKSISDISSGNISDGDSVSKKNAPSRRKSAVSPSLASRSPLPIKLFQTVPSDNRSVISTLTVTSDTERGSSSLLLSQSQLRSQRQSQKRASITSFLNNFSDDLIGKDKIPSNGGHSTQAELHPERSNFALDSTGGKDNGTKVQSNTRNTCNDYASEPMELSTEEVESSPANKYKKPNLDLLDKSGSVQAIPATSSAAAAAAGLDTGLIYPESETLTATAAGAGAPGNKEEYVLRRHRRILQMLQEFRCTVKEDEQEATRREKALEQKIAAAVVPIYSPLERVNVTAKALIEAEQEVVKMMRSWNAVQKSAVAHLRDCDTKLAAERTRFIIVQRQLDRSEQDLVAEGEVHREALDKLHEVVRSVAQKNGTATLHQQLASYPASWFEGIDEGKLNGSFSVNMNTSRSGRSVQSGSPLSLAASGTFSSSSQMRWGDSGGDGGGGGGDGTGTSGAGGTEHSRTEISDLDTLNKGEYLNKVMPSGDSFQQPWTFSIDKAVVEGLTTAAKAGYRFYGPPSLQHRAADNSQELQGDYAHDSAERPSRPGSASNSRSSSRTRARSGTLSSLGTTALSAYLQHSAEPPPPPSPSPPPILSSPPLRGYNYGGDYSDMSTDGRLSHSRQGHRQESIIGRGGGSKGLHSSGDSVTSLSTRDSRSVSTSRLGGGKRQYSRTLHAQAPTASSMAHQCDEGEQAELRNQALISRAILKLEKYRNNVRAEGATLSSAAASGRAISPSGSGNSMLKMLSQQQALSSRLSAHHQHAPVPHHAHNSFEEHSSGPASHITGSGSGPAMLRRASSASAASLRRSADLIRAKHVIHAPSTSSPSSSTARAAVAAHPNPSSTTTGSSGAQHKVSRTLTRSPTFSAASTRYHSLHQHSSNLFSPTTGAPMDFRDEIASGVVDTGGDGCTRAGRSYSGATNSSDAGYSGTRYSDYLLEDMVVDEASGALKFSRMPQRKRSSKQSPCSNNIESYSYVGSPSHSHAHSRSDSHSPVLSPVPTPFSADRSASAGAGTRASPPDQGSTQGNNESNSEGNSESNRAQSMHHEQQQQQHHLQQSQQVRPDSPVITGNQWTLRSTDKAHISSSSSGSGDNDAQSVHSRSVQVSASVGGGGDTGGDAGGDAGGDSFRRDSPLLSPFTGGMASSAVLRVAQPVSSLRIQDLQHGRQQYHYQQGSTSRSKTPPPWTSTRSISISTPNVDVNYNSNITVPTAPAGGASLGPGGGDSGGTGKLSKNKNRRSISSNVPKVPVPVPSPSPVLARAGGGSGSVPIARQRNPTPTTAAAVMHRTTVAPNQAQLTAQAEAARYLESLRRSIK